MSIFKTFKKGGLHPRSIGIEVLEKEIQNANLPHFVYIPLNQHIGAPAKAVVKPGDKVKMGDVIGEANGFVSSNIHSSVPGEVKEIIKYDTSSADNVETIVIEFAGGLSISSEKKHADKWRDKSSKDIISSLQKMGIVGLGGATFPTHVKFSVPKDKKVDTLIINAVECEPYLSADYRLMMEKSSEIISGIEIVRTVLGINKVIIGIEADTPKAIKIMQEAASTVPDVEVLPLKVKYPQGAEKQLIKAAIGKEVPSGELPMSVGAVVSNVGTIFAIKEAIIDNKPLFERVVTVTGSLVKNPGNYKIKIGTTLRDVLEEVGLKGEPAKIIFGGPMMGFAQHSLDVPVVKGTSGIIVLSEKETVYYNDDPCVSCGKCITVCPMGLNPTKIVRKIELGRKNDSKEDGLMDCIQCGACSYICPSQKHLAQVIKLGKLQIAADLKGGK